MEKLFVYLTCIVQTPIYYDHTSKSQGHSVKTGSIVFFVL